MCSVEPLFLITTGLYDELLRNYLRDTYWNYAGKRQASNSNGLFGFRLVKEKLHTSQPPIAASATAFARRTII